jgi:hypothetical protein
LNGLADSLLDAAVTLERVECFERGEWHRRSEVVSGFLTVSADFRASRAEAARCDIRVGEQVPFDVIVPQAEERADGDTWLIVSANDQVRRQLPAGRYRLRTSIAATTLPRLALPVFELTLGFSDEGGTRGQTSELAPAEWCALPLDSLWGGAEDDNSRHQPSCGSGSWVVLTEDFTVLRIDGVTYRATPREAAFLGAMHAIGYPTDSKTIHTRTHREWGTRKLTDVFGPTSRLRGTVLVKEDKDLWRLSRHRHATTGVVCV